METATIIAEIWPIVACFLAGLVWLIRLEAKVLYLEKDNEDHWNKLDEVQKKLDGIAESLARLEGKLETRFLDD